MQVNVLYMGHWACVELYSLGSDSNTFSGPLICTSNPKGLPNEGIAGSVVDLNRSEMLQEVSIWKGHKFAELHPLG